MAVALSPCVAQVAIPEEVAERARREGVVVVPSELLTGGEPWRQMYEAYRPHGVPLFITTDAVLDAYLALLGEAREHVARVQGEGMRVFLQRLEASSSNGAPGSGRGQLARMAEIGLELLEVGPGDAPRPEAGTAALVRAQAEVVAACPGARIERVAEDSWYPGLVTQRAHLARRLLEAVVFDATAKGEDSAWDAWRGLLRDDEELRRAWEHLERPWNELEGPFDPLRGLLGVTSDGVPIPGSRRSILGVRPSDFGAVLDASRDTGAEGSGLGMLSRGPFRQGWTRPRELPLAQGIVALVAELPTMLDPEAGSVFLSEAWGQKTQITRLGAWAELGCRPFVQQKSALVRLPEVEGPVRVAPYPRFFEELAKQCERTLEWIERSIPGDLEERQRLLRADRDFYRANSRSADIALAALAQAARPPGGVGTSLLEPVESLDPSSMDILRAWTSGRAAAELERLATCCRELARIARKQTGGEPLLGSDERLLHEFGVHIARANGYGSIATVPADDHARCARAASAEDGRGLYIGVGRPDALLVVLDVDGESVIHLGAVFDYREVWSQEHLGGSDWREQLGRGLIPPPDAFSAVLWR